MGLLESKRSAVGIWSNLLKNRDGRRRAKRHKDCYLEGASDVPAAGELPASPQNSRRSARAAANEAVDRPREPVEGAMDTTVAHNCWEASDQRRDTNAARSSGVCACARSYRVRFCAINRVRDGYGCTSAHNRQTPCAVLRDPVLSNLPIKRLSEPPG